MEQQEQHAESLAELAALAGTTQATPQLLVHLARALDFAGRAAEAESRLEEALLRWPTDVPLHIQLTQLRWQRGAGEFSTRSIERAIEQFPRELGLRLVAADQLRNAGYLHKALGLLEGGLALAPDSAAFLTSMGVMLDALDRPAEALPFLTAAVARHPASVSARRNLAATLLRVGRAADALPLIDELAAGTPDDQQLIAFRATALRLLGDPGYGKLCDYARLVRAYPLRAPEEFADIEQFNSAFAAELLRLHRASERPLAQSLRGGTQTDRNLPARNPVIANFFAMIDAPIRDYIAQLQPGMDHPTDRRKSSGYRIAGSWSVQLAPGGFHTNHVHPQGWLSSAYYVELPEVACGEIMRIGRAGYIETPSPFLEQGLALRGLEPPENWFHKWFVFSLASDLLVFELKSPETVSQFCSCADGRFMRDFYEAVEFVGSQHCFRRKAKTTIYYWKSSFQVEVRHRTADCQRDGQVCRFHGMKTALLANCNDLLRAPRLLRFRRAFPGCKGVFRKYGHRTVFVN